MAHERGKRKAAPGARERDRDKGRDRDRYRDRSEGRRARAAEGPAASLALRVRLLLSAAVLVTLLAGFAGPSNWLWGMNLLRYYPDVFRVLWAVLALGVIWLAPLEWGRGGAAAASGASETGELGAGAGGAFSFAGLQKPITWSIGAAVVSAILFNVFRTESLLLGDGMEIVRRLHQGNVPAPRSALYNVIEPVFFHTFSGGNARSEGIAAGILSILCGTVAVAVATFHLVRLGGRDAAGARTAGALLLLTGALQLFFGYIEVYPLLVAATIIFHAAMLDRLTGGDRLSAWVATGALLFGLASHPFGATLVPGWLYMVSLTPREGELRVDRRRLGLAAGAGTILMAILWIAFEVRPEWRETGGAFRFMAPQELVRGLARSLGTLLHARPWADRYRVTSIVHLSDIWNTLWLVGAAALAVVVAVLSTSVGRKGLARPPVMAALLSLAGIVLLRALFRTPLGSLRDWDLFAGFGLGVAALAAGFSVTTPVRNLFVPITAAAIFFLVPWIGIQTSNSRAATRHFDAIDAEPRPEPPVAAYFHCVMGDRFANLRRYDLAQSAYRRALEAYPRYEFAWRLGTVRLVAKDFPGAITAFEKALELDPENLTTRVVLAEALMGAGQLERARDLLNEALAAGASVALAHLRLAQIDHRQGKSREATEHLALAEAALGPGDEAVRREMEDFRRGMAAAP